MLAAVVATIGAGAALIHYRNSMNNPKDDSGAIGARARGAVPSFVNSPPKPVDLPKATAHFPRRFLAICVHDYLYANPVSGRGDKTGMPDVLRGFARDKLRVDSDQTYIVSDAVNGKATRAPIKPIIEQTVERFLATCRRQDRIMLLFVGHAVDVDDEPFLVPLEGELGVKETLIPLKWLFDRLATCPARQKVLVMDVCRTDIARQCAAGERADGAEAERRSRETSGRGASTDGVCR